MLNSSIMDAALVAKEVTKELAGRTILSNISFSVEQGEIFGIIGMSGSGKTTMLHHLIGFLEPDQGDILFRDGENMKALRDNLMLARRSFGFSPQKPSFYPQLTLEENLWYFGGLYHLKKDIIKKNIEKLLTLTKLYDHKEKLAEELSGGMGRRLSLACSMMHSPSVLILDEPTADLDPILRDEMWQLIKRINKLGTTIVVASHFLEELEKVSDSIAILHDGLVLKSGSLKELRKNFTKAQAISITLSSDEEVKKLVSQFKQSNMKTVVRGHEISIAAKHPLRLLAKLTQATAAGRINPRSLYLHDPTLRDVFTKLAKGDDN